MEPFERNDRLFGVHCPTGPDSIAVSFRRTHQQTSSRAGSHDESRQTCQSTYPKGWEYYIFMGAVRDVSFGCRVKCKCLSRDRQSYADNTAYKSSTSQTETSNRREEGRSEVAAWNRQVDGGGNNRSAPVFKVLEVRNCVARRILPLAPYPITTSVAAAPGFKVSEVRSCIGWRSLPRLDHNKL